MPQQMPPTPPDHHYTENGYGSSHLPSVQSTAFNTPAPHYDYRSPEEYAFAKQYSQYLGAPMLRPAYLPDHIRQVPATYAPPQLSSSSNTYGALAPGHPPIRLPDRSLDDYPRQLHAKRAHAAIQPKEEKIGGVAAHLDYEMDEMVDFMSEMTQGMYDIFASKICLADIDMTRSVVSSESPVHPDFRKYVSQVLSATRLPSSTILVSLYYLAMRMTLLSNEGRYSQRQNDIYPMLTTALLLGSKFLDDNTFQNRSWSEVSNISVKELNMLEIEWLMDINWNMHIDPNDPEGFLLWRRNWNKFQANKADLSLAASMKKTHIEYTGPQHPSQHQASAPLARYPYSHPEQSSRLSFTDRTQSQWNTARYEKWPPAPSQNNCSPPSAPETGPNTPDSYNMFGYGHQAAIHPSIKLPPVLQMMPTNVVQPDIFAPYQQQSYNHFGHGTACGCSYCQPNHNRYTMDHAYGPQSVAG